MIHLGNAPRVAIVGAGLGGLSAAIRLASAGYPVTVFEKQPGPGGKAFTERLGRYRFDTGPSLFTMRHVFEQLFAEAGVRLQDYLTLHPLERICNYFWRDGTRTATFADSSMMGAEFAHTFGEPPENLDRYLTYSRTIYDITAHLFLERSLHEWRTLRTKGFFRSLARLPRIDAMRTMDKANRSFFHHPRLHQLFNRYATYNGSDPYQSPATLNVIPHVEYGLGAWAVEGGIYAVPVAMERLARELGVDFHYDARVDRILTGSHPPRRRSHRNCVRGIRVDGRDHPAEIVISNADVTATYRKLLDDADARPLRRHEKLEPSSSGLVFYWGIGRRFPELGLHNIFFSDDYHAEFSDIFEGRRVPSDPTIYLNVTSKEGGTGDAPVEGENWFILLNAPWDGGQDWEEEATRARQRVLTRLSDELRLDVESLIEVESRMLPPDIEKRTDSSRGSLYGIASNTRTAAFRRHPNRSRRYPGLFFVGGSAHPGGGMPLVVLGGKIVADLVGDYHPLARPL